MLASNAVALRTVKRINHAHATVPFELLPVGQAWGASSQRKTYRAAERLRLARLNSEKISGLLGTSSSSRGTERLREPTVVASRLSLRASILFRCELPYSIARSIKLFFDDEGLLSMVVLPLRPVPRVDSEPL